MILLIDNYDSFVHNLARYCQLFGHVCEIHRNDTVSLDDIEAMQPSHILLSPGPCTPDEAGICLPLIQQYHQIIPILGVCLGHQAIGQAFGGNVVSANQPNHGKSLPLQHKGEGLFGHLPKNFPVGLYHSLVVAPDTLPSCLKVTAWSDHGDIMAIQHHQYPSYGVQFHPESILTEHGLQILEAFLKKTSLGTKDLKPIDQGSTKLLHNTTIQI